MNGFSGTHYQHNNPSLFKSFDQQSQTSEQPLSFTADNSHQIATRNLEHRNITESDCGSNYHNGK